MAVDTSVNIKLVLAGASGVKVGLQEIGAVAGALHSKLLPLGAALAGAAGLGSLAYAAVQTAKLGGELSDLSARTGISARSLITLRQAFNDTGVGADAVGTYVNKLQQSLVHAAEGGGEAANAFAALGLNAQELNTLAPEEQFSRIGAAVSKIEDPARRASAVMSIFGKGAGDLLVLFSEDGAIDNAAKVLGKMPEVLARNVPVLDTIADIFDRLPNKATQLFAGIYDQLGPTVQSLLEAFESIDLTVAGQKIGAFVGLAIDRFREGRFDQFIGDVVEAGFEIGVEAGYMLLKGLSEWLGSGSFWAAMGNAFFTAWNNTLALVAEGIMHLRVPVETLVKFLTDSLIFGFQKAWNFFAETGLAIGNVLAEKLNAIFGTNFGIVDVTGANTAVTAPSMERSWEQAKADARDSSKIVRDWLDEATQVFREMTGGGFNAPRGARERLSAGIAERMAARDAAGGEAMPRRVNGEDQGPAFKQMFQAAELAFQERLIALRNQAGAVESNWLLTTNQKRERRLAILDEEVRLIDQQITALEQLRAAATPDEQAQIDRQIAGLRGQRGGLRNQALALGPDPASFSEQWAAALVQLQDQFLTVAQFTARAFTDAFTTATSAISQGIQGLIYGTVTWGQALLNIGQSIVQSLVKSFSDMVAQWIMTHVLMKGVSTAWSAFQSALRAKDVAEANATEAAKMPALAANATLASIGSWGVAAVVGVAAIAGILAAMGAFKEGGYTGDGGRDEVAGIVHRGEFVVPADAVDRIGVGTLEAMSAGAQVGPAVVASTGGGASPITLNMGVFDDPRRLSDWARSVDGRSVILDIVRQSAHEFRA